MTKPKESAEEVLEKIIEKENLTGDAKRFTWAEVKYAMESYKDQCVREACKKQRDLCADELSKRYIPGQPEQVYAVRNAPEPKL